MRALIMASVSGETVICPSSTSARKVLIRLLPRSRAGASAPKRPLSTISSSSVSVSTAPACRWTWLSVVDIGASLDIQPRLRPGELIRIRHGFLEELLQLLVALQAAAQIRQLRAQREQLLQRIHL